MYLDFFKENINFFRTIFCREERELKTKKKSKEHTIRGITPAVFFQRAYFGAVELGLYFFFNCFDFGLSY